jgi:hypothetical protein
MLFQTHTHLLKAKEKTRLQAWWGDILWNKVIMSMYKL